MGDHIALALLGVLGLLLVSAGIEDARTREIANWKTATIALAAPLWWWANGISPWPDMASQIGVAALVFGFFAAAFAVGQMGGGDVKLIGALALWLPPQPFMTTFVSMTLIGGALTALMVADEWVRRRAAPPRPAKIVAAGTLFALALGAALGPLATAPVEPVSALLGLIVALCAISVLLVMAVRAARRRGIAPETPYGVAIAAAGLLAMREPIINQFG